ncbi:MAG: hypothetical protein JNM56_30890, partial [Planctomycetia bacterium]|nr:hypothetical protein [Planctomycetia bacterium]
MAFNPFHKFRKHQKVIFACITIMVMVVFVGSAGMSGGGDPFHWLQGLLLSGRAQGGEVATIDGKKVTYVELQELRRQRQLANAFMTASTNYAMNNIIQELRPPTGSQPDFRQQFEFETKVRNNREIQRLQSRMGVDPRTGQPDPKRPYFGGSLDGDGLLEFMVWQKQADKLGIDIDPDDLEREIKRLTEKRVERRADFLAIEAYLRQEFGRYTHETLREALRQEFRVQLAQVAMLGQSGNNTTRVPDPATPQDFWDWYKDKRTEIMVDLLPVKVEDFLSQVKEQPTAKELEELYKKGKDREFFPEAKDPAFKQPRRVGIEWVSAKSDSPAYKQAAQDLRKLVQEVQQIGAVLPGSPFAGITSAANVAFPPTFDYLLHEEYERSKGPSYRLASYTRPWSFLPPYPMHEQNFHNPLNIAAAVGQAGGEVAGLGALGTYLGGATYRDEFDRIARGSTWLLSGESSPLTALAMGAYLYPKQEYQPLESVKEQVEQSLDSRLRENLMFTNLRTLVTEVDKLAKAGGDKKQEKITEYLAQAVKQYHLETGKSSEPRDRYKNKIADDPGLKPLMDAYLKPPSRDPEGNRYAEMFFSERKPYEPEPLQRDALDLKTSQEAIIFWKTEDLPPKVVPFDNPEVRKEVEAYWKFNKARELAKKEAEQLAIKAREQKGDDRKLEDFAAQLKKPLIKLAPISRLMRKPSQRPDIANTYRPPIVSSPLLRLNPFMGEMTPDIPDTKVPNAGFDFPTELLKLQDKEKGDTLVVADAPVGTYYVAVLVNKQAPPLDDFFKTYRQSSTAAISKDPLLMNYERERQ